MAALCSKQINTKINIKTCSFPTKYKTVAQNREFVRKQ